MAVGSASGDVTVYSRDLKVNMHAPPLVVIYRQFNTSCNFVQNSVVTYACVLGSLVAF